MFSLPPPTSCLLSGDGLFGLRKLDHWLCIFVCVAGLESQWSGLGAEGNKGKSEGHQSRKGASKMKIWTAYQFFASQASVHHLLPASIVMELDLHLACRFCRQHKAGFIERTGVCEGAAEARGSPSGSGVLRFCFFLVCITSLLVICVGKTWWHSLPAAFLKHLGPCQAGRTYPDSGQVTASPSALSVDNVNPNVGSSSRFLLACPHRLPQHPKELSPAYLVLEQLRKPLHQVGKPPLNLQQGLNLSLGEGTSLLSSFLFRQSFSALGNYLEFSLP